MKRLLAVALLAAVTGVGVPAHAGGVPLPGGTCDDPVDVACTDPPPCNPEDPCDPVPCLVWLNSTCAIR